MFYERNLSGIMTWIMTFFVKLNKGNLAKNGWE